MCSYVNPTKQNNPRKSKYIFFVNLKILLLLNGGDCAIIMVRNCFNVMFLFVALDTFILRGELGKVIYLTLNENQCSTTF